MRYRKFVKAFIAALLIFVAVNFIFWKMWTENLITSRYNDGGDLARMGYLPGSKMPRHNAVDLARRHIPYKEYDGRKVDLITIGDSFSNGAAGGKNRFYQDYIATLNNFDVLNIPRHQDLSILASTHAWMQNGFIGSTAPRYLLLGISEKACGDLSEPLPSVDMKLLEKNRLYDYDIKPPKYFFINSGNAKLLLNKVLYTFSDRAVFSQVHIGKLQQAFFGVKNSDQLLYLRNRSIPSHDQILRMNENLNMLAAQLRTMGITLIFMPCVDKFNLYREYLDTPRYTASTLFEDLRSLPKKYLFIDTKAILAEELKKGEKDIFYADDTHWSWKASEAIFRKQILK